MEAALEGDWRARIAGAALVECVKGLDAYPVPQGDLGDYMETISFMQWRRGARTVGELDLESEDTCFSLAGDLGYGCDTQPLQRQVFLANVAALVKLLLTSDDCQAAGRLSWHLTCAFMANGKAIRDCPILQPLMVVALCHLRLVFHTSEQCAWDFAQMLGFMLGAASFEDWRPEEFR